MTADQSFWTASATDGNLSWDIDSGRWIIAVLNADGSPGVDVDVTAAARVPLLRPIGIALVVAGLIGLAIGVTLTYLGVGSTPAPYQLSRQKTRPRPLESIFTAGVVVVRPEWNRDAGQPHARVQGG